MPVTRRSQAQQESSVPPQQRGGVTSSAATRSRSRRKVREDEPDPEPAAAPPAPSQPTTSTHLARSRSKKKAAPPKVKLPAPRKEDQEEEGGGKSQSSLRRSSRSKKSNDDEQQSDEPERSTSPPAPDSAPVPVPLEEPQPETARPKAKKRQGKKVAQKKTATTTTASIVPPPPQPAAAERAPVISNYLPSRDLFPFSANSHAAQAEKLRSLKPEVRRIVGLILNEVQENEHGDFKDQYRRIERLYNYLKEVCPNMDGEVGTTANSQDVDTSSVGVPSIGNRYKRFIISVLWSHGMVLWRMPNSNNYPFIQKVDAFLEDCFMRLGWKEGGGSDGKKGRSRKNKKVVWEEWDAVEFPAIYYVAYLFGRHNSEANNHVRLRQLQIIHKLVQQATDCNSEKYLRHVNENLTKTLMTRIKDRCTHCRAVAMSVLSLLVNLPGAAMADAIIKELKYSTRYDPATEVRRIGTFAVSKVERLKLRFFFDQAFDRNMGVRYEAFRALGVEMEAEEGESPRLIRDMTQLISEKVCKLVLWGTLYSDEKVSNYVKTELLPKWLRISCSNSLVQFLTNLDPFLYLAAVLKIMDMMFTGSEMAHRCAESVDLGFIAEVKANVFSKDPKLLSVEGMVGWLGMCRASKEVESLRQRVLPSADEMNAMVQCLHECVLIEYNAANLENRDEVAHPMFCLVISLEICRWVVWEEGTRVQLKRMLKEILIDPILDEKMLVTEAMNLLSKFAVNGEFGDIMMDVLQDVFDKRNGGERRKSMMGEVMEGEVENQQQRKDNSERSAVEEVSNGVNNVVGQEEPTPPPRPPSPLPMTEHQLSKLREKICELAGNRLSLSKRKDALLAERRYIEAVPVDSEITKLKEEEELLRKELLEQEAFDKLAKERQTNQIVQAIQQAQNKSKQAEDEQQQSMSGTDEPCVEDDEEEDEADGALDHSGVINSVEEGLAKGMVIINGFMDICPEINPLIRNLYENYACNFMLEKDCNVRVSVLQFMTRVALIDKRELMRVTHILWEFLCSSEIEYQIVNAAYKCFVDLLVAYDYSDFLQGRDIDDDVELPYMKDFTRHLQKYLATRNVTYRTCTSHQIKKLFLEVLGNRFPAPKVVESAPEKKNHELLETKYKGLTKLLVRGRLRDPAIVSRILMLWINNDYSGTHVLRDLEDVLKLYGTWHWWRIGECAECGPLVEEEEGEDDEVNSEDGRKVVRNEAMRVVGVAVAEAVLYLFTEGKGTGVREEDFNNNVLKFVEYFVSFLDRKDQPLMRTIAQKILDQVAEYPSRSYNYMLVHCVTKIPITSYKAAKIIASLLYSTVGDLLSLPGTTSETKTKRALRELLKKYVRVFGEEIVEEEVEKSRLEREANKDQEFHEVRFTDSEDELEQVIEGQDEDNEEEGGGGVGIGDNEDRVFEEEEEE